MPASQMPLQIKFDDVLVQESYRGKLIGLLSQDLNFHDQDSRHPSHNFHSFPAKFPPQLPRKFINALTKPGDTVLDPMMGSGTTILEALLAGRRGIGFDIDPLALMITGVKISPFDVDQIEQLGASILKQATHSVSSGKQDLLELLEKNFDPKTQDFIDHWFAPETQIELMALIAEIEKITDPRLKIFFKALFSSIIITKSGGVSMALDLGHTRPHRAKTVIVNNESLFLSEDNQDKLPVHAKLLTKILRSPLEEFEKRFKKSLNGLTLRLPKALQPQVILGNVQNLPLDDATVDLIVTSPPYASNAIDYMRAHKFSLVWMHHSIDSLSVKRREYIGGEAMTNVQYLELPDKAARLVDEIARIDKRKGRILHRYYSEMTCALREMYRVLKPDKAAIVVVGSSSMRGRDTDTHACLAEIGKSIGFEVPMIGERDLDRNRRMMPAGTNLDLNSQIQKRMYKEYVIGFYRPDV